MIDRQRVADRERVGRKIFASRTEQAPIIKRIGFDLDEQERNRLLGIYGNTRVPHSPRRHKNYKDSVSRQELRANLEWPWYDF
ncbi:hypothetical protein [Desulfobaculum bizertense]|uniref:Uncharacterized protein n=1 Tax=Desulfobaculum bizertense DSM 18034 TaxID=1121442 RepID=A0A1T4WSB1_9BACT|nr:hypothetical protein [Desulfobaculum bizertense]UIJ37297.1 hypothetical protein LWC08_11220 [Desulfobaculum bizertense]SKA79735.1 hypothetical protein SAMN02745702_02568 [Desulfobaculum bizertense DSM 18034]